MDFNAKLQKLRKEHGMSQEELATQLNVSRQAVSKWENGQGFPEMEKILQMSSIYGVSLDYLLKDETVAEGAVENDSSYYASREMVDAFLLARRQSGVQIAIGVAVIILAFVWLFVAPENVAIVPWFLQVAVGVGVLVMVGFRPRRYAEEITSLPLMFDGSYIREFRNRYQSVRKNCGIGITCGIFSILLGIVCQIFAAQFSAGTSAGGAGEERFLALLFVFAAIGVAVIIIATSILNAWAIIAENDKHMQELSDERRTGWVPGVIMPLCAIAFLFIGFTTGAWHPGWLVFPFGALLSAGISAIINAARK